MRVKALFLSDCLGIKNIDRKYYISAGDTNPATGKQYAVNPSSGVWDDNYFANTYGNKDNGAAYDSAIKDAGGSSLDFATGLNSMENNAFDDYVKASQSQPKALDLYNSLEDAAGVPTLRKTAGTLQGQINTLQDAIDGAERNVSQTTQQSLVTEGQRTGMVNAARYPLIQQLNPLSTSLGQVQSGITNAEQGINQKVGYAMTDSANSLKPYETRMSLVSQQAARMMTGFTSDKESKLQVILAKIHRGEQVSDQEAADAQALSLAKLGYDNQLKLLQEKDDSSDTLTALGKYGLYDPATGKIIGASGGSGSGTDGFNVSGDDPLGLGL